MCKGYMLIVFFHNYYPTRVRGQRVRVGGQSIVGMEKKQYLCIVFRKELVGRAAQGQRNLSVGKKPSPRRHNERKTGLNPATINKVLLTI